MTSEIRIYIVVYEEYLITNPKSNLFSFPFCIVPYIENTFFPRALQICGNIAYIAYKSPVAQSISRKIRDTSNTWHKCKRKQSATCIS